MITSHFLKIWPEHYLGVVTGMKKAELRLNDRAYSVGDFLILKEYQPDVEKFTGLEVQVEVTHIADVGEWLPGYVMLSFERFCWTKQ